jgi:hypothetical protein
MGVFHSYVRLPVREWGPPTFDFTTGSQTVQDHYDFGMRAVKSVLVMAGQLKRKYPTLVEDLKRVAQDDGF